MIFNYPTLQVIVNCIVSTSLLGANWLYEKQTSFDSISKVAYYYQFGLIKEPSLNVMGRILENIFNSWLATRSSSEIEATAEYKIKATAKSFGPTTGFIFNVQGDKHPANMFLRLEKDIDLFVSESNELRPDIFKEAKEVLASDMEKRLPTAFYQKNHKIWDQITSQELDFERETRQIRELNNLTLQDFQQFVQVSSGFICP